MQVGAAPCARVAGVRVQVSTHVLDLPLETLLAALFSALPRARAYHNEGEERREERGTYALLVRWAKQDVTRMRQGEAP